MRIIAAGLLAFLAVSGAALAQSGLRPLATADEGRGFEAVGRIEIGTSGFCTGTLIADDLVLTAAHCLFDPDSSMQRDLGSIEFRAGWRDGRAEAYRGVSRAILHPDYAHQPRDMGGASRVVHDIAILVLDRPIRTSSIQPLATGTKPRKGDEVGVVSYAVNREERPSLERVCSVLARPAHMLIISCTVDFGASGAPILSFEGGEPRVVSVVSAKAESRGRPVSLGADIDGALDRLLALARTPAPPTAFRASVNRPGTAGQSAKFVRP